MGIHFFFFKILDVAFLFSIAFHLLNKVTKPTLKLSLFQFFYALAKISLNTFQKNLAKNICVFQLFKSKVSHLLSIRFLPGKNVDGQNFCVTTTQYTACEIYFSGFSLYFGKFCCQLSASSLLCGHYGRGFFFQTCCHFNTIFVIFFFQSKTLYESFIHLREMFLKTPHMTIWGEEERIFFRILDYWHEASFLFLLLLSTLVFLFSNKLLSSVNVTQEKYLKTGKTWFAIMCKLCITQGIFSF